MAECLIKLAGVGKRYPVARNAADRLRGLWNGLAGRPPSRGEPALRGIDLRIARGDAVAVLGENGAGKSTLLKIVAGVLRPSTGSVTVNGRVGALLDLGAGFDPEFSGRQNVQTAAMLAGLAPAEIGARMHEIVAFAQLGAAIDQPVKHYSSGMTVRLGFAVITALRPDILISDEVLAVGDESFQKKCIRWLQDYLAGGGTLLLVSHSIYHVQKLCRSALWIHHGAVRRRGDVFAVSQAYLAHHEARLRAAAGVEQATTRARIDSLRTNGLGADRMLVLGAGESLELAAELRGLRPGDQVRCRILQIDGSLIASHRAPAGEAQIRLTLEDLPLLPGHYRLELLPTDDKGVRCGDPERRLLQVKGVSREFGSVRVPHQWG